MNNTLYLFAGALFGLIIGGALANRFKGYHTINFKLNQIMATLAEFQAAFAEINDTTNNIAADIERLANGIASGMTEAEETQALSELQGIAAKLKTIADTTPEETTPTE